MAAIRARKMQMQAAWKENCKQPEYVGEITEEVVKQHQTKEDFWVIINNDVYNITQYLNSHPGGTSCLMASDITKAFNNFHQGQHLDLIEKLKIGRVAGR